MDITSYAISTVVALSQARTVQAMSLAVMKKSLDAQEVQGMALVEMLNSVPKLNHLLDTYA